jgi:hypothetical protein
MPRLADAHRDREELVRPCGGIALPASNEALSGEISIPCTLFFGFLLGITGWL